jgi:Aldehyde dehydrogenase family
MKAIMKSEAIKTITTHYIDGGYVESHGREVMDLINPTTAQVIGHVTSGDEEDARRAIAAAKRAFATFGRSTKEERSEILRRLHDVVSARIRRFDGRDGRGVRRFRSVRCATCAGGCPCVPSGPTSKTAKPHSCPGYFEG